MNSEPPEYEILNNEKTVELLKMFHGERTGWVQVGDKKWFFPYKYIEEGQHFFKFKARPSDTWVVSYPRSGTTWTQELVWLVSNDLDFETARTQFLTKRFPFLEFSMFYHPELAKEFLEMNKENAKREQMCKDFTTPGYKVLDSLPSPRFIKSHFPFSLLPGILNAGCKIVYVARNPKDVAVSWYYWNKAIKTQGYQGNFHTFWDYFENNLVPWSPYWEHLKEAWANRHRPNVLFIFYEEMQKDLPKAIEKVASFVGKTYSRKDILKLAEHLNIENFRNNPMVNFSQLKECGILTNGTFIRNGQRGMWEDMFTPELEKRADKWIKDNLKDVELDFPYLNNNYM